MWYSDFVLYFEGVDYVLSIWQMCGCCLLAS